MKHAPFRSLLPALALFLLAGCDPVSLTLLSVGAGVGINHAIDGIASKTFTEPLPKVKKATLTALNRMAIKVNSVEKEEAGESIKARSADRDIDIELEAISAKATRMRATARNVALLDSATADEIILQTGKALGAR